MALWDGRFGGGPNAEMQAFSESLDTDLLMWQEDIAGSIAHVTMLGEVGLISAAEAEDIKMGLKRVETDLANGWVPNIDQMVLGPVGSVSQSIVQERRARRELAAERPTRQYSSQRVARCVSYHFEEVLVGQRGSRGVGGGRHIPAPPRAARRLESTIHMRVKALQERRQTPRNNHHVYAVITT